MDTRDIRALRDRLNSLSYTQHLEPASAPLVSALLEDLIQVTEGHRVCKLESDRYMHERSRSDDQVDRHLLGSFTAPLS